MKLRCFDFEVFPHWWCCVFGDIPDDLVFDRNIKNDYIVVTSDDVDARDHLIQLMMEEGVCVTGYNIKNYDLEIANAIYQGFSPEQVKIVNDLIIHPYDCQWSTKEHIRLQPFAKRKIANVVYQDLMDDSSGSLKEKETVLGLNILESNVDFDKADLTEQEKDDVIYYCKQDVYAAMKFYQIVVAPYTRTKLALAKKANIPESVARACTNARLVSMALKAQRRSYIDAEKVEVELPEKIKQYCKDNLPENILNRLLTSNTGFTVKLFGNDVSFGNGGIHSVLQTNIYIESDSEWTLMNVDASSYYPSILIQFECLSRSVTQPHLFKDTFDERIAIKHKPNKTAEDQELQLADKLILNTTFGASGNKWLDLYDPHMCTRTCRLGQIFLAALACKIDKTIADCKIIQTNTDGILVYIKRDQIPKLEELQAEWSRVSGINMDADHVVKIWQRDVNNYLLVKDDNGVMKVKRKGGWLNTDTLRPGYVTTASLAAFVCAKAGQEWLLNGTNIIKTIAEDTDITDFLISCTKGPSFSGVVQKMYEATPNEYEVPLFKANRIIATKDKSYGKIYKTKKLKGNLSYNQMPNIPDHCMPMNEDIEDYNFNELKHTIDYMYYVQRTMDLMDIEWKQLCNNELFDIHQFDIEF